MGAHKYSRTGARLAAMRRPVDVSIDQAPYVCAIRLIVVDRQLARTVMYMHAASRVLNKREYISHIPNLCLSCRAYILSIVDCILGYVLWQTISASERNVSIGSPRTLSPRIPTPPPHFLLLPRRRGLPGKARAVPSAAGLPFPLVSSSCRTVEDGGDATRGFSSLVWGRR
jgi:hypothetical protein